MSQNGHPPIAPASQIPRVSSPDSSNLLLSLDYLRQVVRGRLRHHFGKDADFELPQFQVKTDGTPFSNFLISANPSVEELVTLLLALAPYVEPNFFGQLVAEVMPNGGDFPDFGGVKGTNHRGTLPTGETALFVLAGNDTQRRFALQSLFHSGHYFAKERILSLEQMKEGEPPMSGRLLLDPEIVELFTTGFVSRPKLSVQFPAQYLETGLEWDELVLPELTKKQLRELETWLAHHQTLMVDWGMERRLKPGYRALFYGPPGTGKTLAASLLGKYTGRDVFRVDLSTVVSKFIGETEKNMANLFDKAENKDWILFFDEADSLFGKRTNVRDAHDKYANQEVSYLLQRVEGYRGMVILATNFKANIDEAFIRRFQSVVNFPMPRALEREQLWLRGFPQAVTLASDIDLRQIAEKFELSGSNIMNVVQYCCLQALSSGTSEISAQVLRQGIEREFNKEGKII